MRFSFLLVTITVACLGQSTLDTTFQVSYASNLDKDDSVVNITNTGLQGPFGVSGAAGTAGNICANIYVFDAQEEEISCCSCLVTPNGLNSLSDKNDLIGDTLTPAVPTAIVIKIVGTQPETASNQSFTICNPGNLTDGNNNTLDRPANGLLAWGTNTHVSNSGGVYHTENPFRPALLATTGVPITTLAQVTAGNNQITVSSTVGLAVGATVTGMGIPTGTTVAGIGPGNALGLSNNPTLGAPGVPLTFSAAPQALSAPSEYSQLATICRFLQANGSGFGICNACKTGGLSGTKN